MKEQELFEVISTEGTITSNSQIRFKDLVKLMSKGWTVVQITGYNHSQIALVLLEREKETINL